MQIISPNMRRTTMEHHRTVRRFVRITPTEKRIFFTAKIGRHENLQLWKSN